MVSVWTSFVLTLLKLVFKPSVNVKRACLSLFEHRDNEPLSETFKLPPHIVPHLLKQQQSIFIERQDRRIWLWALESYSECISQTLDLFTGSWQCCVLMINKEWSIPFLMMVYKPAHWILTERLRAFSRAFLTWHMAFSLFFVFFILSFSLLPPHKWGYFIFIDFLEAKRKKNLWQSWSELRFYGLFLSHNLSFSNNKTCENALNKGRSQCRVWMRNVIISRNN